MTQATAVTATKVKGRGRSSFLYRFLGVASIKFEALAYSIATKYTEYNGGQWEFYELSNGGFYMAAPAGQYSWSNPENYSEEKLSADALGIVCSLYALSSLSFERPSAGDMYHQLLEYAYNHPDAAAIMKAID